MRWGWGRAGSHTWQPGPPSPSPTTISTCTIWDLHCIIIIVRRATHNYICILSGFNRSCQVVYSRKVVLCAISRVHIGTFTDSYTVVDVLYSLRIMVEPRWIFNRLFSFHSLEFEKSLGWLLSYGIAHICRKLCFWFEWVRSWVLSAEACMNNDPEAHSWSCVSLITWTPWRWFTCSSPWTCWATGRCCRRGACPWSGSQSASCRPAGQRIIVLSQRRRQFSRRGAGAGVYRSGSAGWDTGCDSTPPGRTETSPAAAPRG